MFRLFRALYAWAGSFLSRGADHLEKRPEIVKQNYEDIITARAKEARELEGAIGDVCGQLAQMRAEQEAIQRKNAGQQELLDGAVALAKKKEAQTWAKMKGAPEDQIRAAIDSDAEIREWEASYANAETTMEANNNAMGFLKSRIAVLEESRDNAVARAKEIATEVQALRSEMAQSMVTMRIAQSFKEINDRLAGIAAPGTTDERLARVRQTVAGVQGQADASSLIAGTDATIREQKLRNAARQSLRSNRFREAAGLTQKVDAAPAVEAPAKDVQLPESGN
jgi:chromosome segregation ATPase